MFRLDFAYYLPISRMEVTSKAGITDEYGMKMLETLDFENAKRNADGLILSEWANHDWQYQINFDPQKGGRPTSISIFGPEKNGERLMIQTCKIEWERLRNEQAESGEIWLPARFHYICDYTKFSANHYREYEGTYRWTRLQTNSPVMPSVDDENWLSPLQSFIPEKELLAGGIEFRQDGNPIILKPFESDPDTPP